MARFVVAAETSPVMAKRTNEDAKTMVRALSTGVETLEGLLNSELHTKLLYHFYKRPVTKMAIERKAQELNSVKQERVRVSH